MTGDPMAVGEGVIVDLNGEDGQRDLPQVDTAEHYLDDNFSDVMRSSVFRIKRKFPVQHNSLSVLLQTTNTRSLWTG